MAGLTREPRRLLDPLDQRIAVLAAEERYEEAADVRDRAAALSAALRRQRRFDLLRRAGRVRFQVGDAWAELDNGLLRRCGSIDDPPSLLDNDETESPPVVDGPPSRNEADELLCIARWLDDNAHRISLELTTGELAEPLPRLPTFVPPEP